MHIKYIQIHLFVYQHFKGILGDFANITILMGNIIMGTVAMGI